MDETIVNKILKTMKQNRRGKIFFTNDFAKFGDYKSCNKALERLSKQGDIMRVTRGIYTIPQKSKYTGDALAPIDETVRAIVKRDKAKIVPTGLFALNILHLSTQVPAKKVYLTDGAPRKFKIGKNTIILKKTTPRNVATKGKISTLAIQALKELKKDYVTEEQIEKIVGILKKENPQHLEHDIKLAPLWIQKIMRKAQTENN
jgi:hypothetical protein